MPSLDPREIHYEFVLITKYLCKSAVCFTKNFLCRKLEDTPNPGF